MWHLTKRCILTIKYIHKGKKKTSPVSFFYVVYLNPETFVHRTCHVGYKKSAKKKKKSHLSHLRKPRHLKTIHTQWQHSLMIATAAVTKVSERRLESESRNCRSIENKVLCPKIKSIIEQYFMFHAKFSNSIQTQNGPFEAGDANSVCSGTNISSKRSFTCLKPSQ